jgi:hypothetical protein
MIRTRLTPAALAAALTLALVSPAAARADDADRDIAVKALTAGAALFTAKDAPGIAATYDKDAVLTLFGKDKDTGELKSQVKHGRGEVEAYYRDDVFKSDSTYHAKNTVEYVRRVAPDLLLIAGYFEPDTESTKPMKLPFVQLRQKQGDVWRVMNLQVYIIFDN